MIAPGQLYLSPEQRAEYGAMCAKALAEAKNKQPDIAPAEVKRGHWTPPKHINLDHIDVNITPAKKSRFFCVENWDEDSQNNFLAGERRKKQASDFEHVDIKRCLGKKNAEFVENKKRKARGEAPATRPEDIRLVSTRKSPTRDETVNKRPPVARFYHREWSGEYRVSIEAMTRQPDAPAPQAGPRFTESLTSRAARNIIDSGAYMAAKHGGYSTFLTLTFDDSQREKIQKIICIKGDTAAAGEGCNGEKAAGPFCRIDWDTETTIGKEVSRFFDGLQKKYQRGWVWEPSTKEKAEILPVWESQYFPPQFVGVKHTAKGPQPIAKKINYCWVAENPDRYEWQENAVGETVYTKTGENPHVHVLLDWQVEKLHFKGWAEQIENLWGKGYAKLEKIRDSKAASTYLMKALGYMTKGVTRVDSDGVIQNSQGRIRGNRYGISSGARAPACHSTIRRTSMRFGAPMRRVSAS